MVHMKQVAMLLERNSRFCHVPTVWLAVETTENMVVLNVDYSAWIVTVLRVILFWSKLFSMKFITLKRQGVSFFIETKHKVFWFKTKPILWEPIQDTLS